MGATSSVSGIDMGMALDASDVDTPRGLSAKKEVCRLRQLMLDQSKETMKLMAAARFAELDKDHSGFLENDELVAVVDWVMESFGSKLGTDGVEVQKKIMDRLDANKDGQLDIGEFQALFEEMLQRTLLMERAKEKFKEFDTNKSGTIESDEIRQVIDWTLQAFPAGNREVYEQRLMANIDANKDGQLDILEFVDLFEQMLARMDLVQRAKSKFEELDADHSGALEREELDSLVSWVLESHVEKTKEQKANFKNLLLTRIDVNKDGKLDITEFTDLFAEMLDRMELVEQAKTKFHLLDVNKNGALEKTELAPLVHQWAAANASLLNVEKGDLVSNILQSLDLDKNGTIDLKEFIEGFDNFLYERKVATKVGAISA